MTDRPKRPRDLNQLAKSIVEAVTGSPDGIVVHDSAKARAAKAGGEARRDTLSQERRSEIAKLAAKKRWDTHK